MNIRREPPKNPLIRDGVSQDQREIPALSPDYVKVDEGDLADFLVFAHKLSQRVSYYDTENKNYYEDKNKKFVPYSWQEFFAGSTPVQIALISKTRPEKVKDDYTANLDNFLKNRLPETLKPIIATWHNLLQQIWDWHRHLEAYTSLKSTIKGLVQTNLREALKRIQSFEQIAQESSIKFYQDFAQEFDLQISSQVETAQILLLGTIPEARAELDVVFQTLFQNYRQIIQLAPKYLRDSLKNRQDHPPHLSLYFAFWEVMQPARDDLNRMTQRHLDFFYRQVLHLSDRPAEPDHAHLIFELAKSQTEYKLDGETRLIAGIDASGVELSYKLDSETVIHKAQIASLKGLFLNSQEIASGQEPKNLLGLHISPQVNSFDGKGGDFPKEQAVKAWLPFGDQKRDRGKLGLAIASNIFYLREGSRTLVFTLTFDKAPVTLKTSDLANIFTVDFSGKKGWIKGEILPSQTSETSLEGQILKLAVNLGADKEPIEIYHPELDGAKLSINQAVARLQLQDEVLVNGLSAYSYFRNLKLTGLTISTKEIEVRDLVLQNDLSIINPTKPFQPFGVSPKVGATFYVGSKEVFQKNLSVLKIKILWQGLPTDLSTHYRGYYLEGEANSPNFKNFAAKVERLTHRTWSSESLPNDYNLFEPSDEDYRILADRTASQTPIPGDQIDNLTSFNLQTDAGFLRFVLKQSFLHDEFAPKYTIQTLASAKNFQAGEYVNQAVYEVVTVDDKQKKTSTFKRWRTGDDDLPKNKNVAPITINEPYTPVIQEISLKYTAIAEQKDCTLFHLYPFAGFAPWDEQQPDFLPQFINEGELLIGLENLDPPTALPLLFQVLEESADTNLARVNVDWYYLKDNHWISLSDRIVSDFTNGLISSGIINLGIPGDISKNNTILDPNLHWIKASVKSGSRAICQIIGVHTQAARVTFFDVGNDPNHLATPLPSGAIAKLAVPTAAIKKIEQPYNSFGGKVKEQPSHFYTRISEHLRHKGRAVTIFDYERLVLEKFPEIYKVRCINHGKVDEDQQFQELVPGTVTLVVIPKLSPDRISQELEPKVNINLLEKIQEYLLALGSPWADIQVVNPIYEHIQVEFAVKFKSAYNVNFGYYRQELDRGIINFLTPWTIDPQAEINFGGVIYRSSILNFVEQQYYVDYVVDFQMHHENQRDVREAIASTARSILTSVPIASTSSTHIINEAITLADNQKFFSGTLGYEPLGKIILQPEQSETQQATGDNG
ncbi:hypothetical protein NIES2100_29830 [Calothrix sp. NIES-2100]|uniref:baseplate J/gp47 family protein n=1 Tax=Calothrix sp. NIES-2100 TaxID=1954172 RepID=UPI000B614B50|nr:hypothetical protein NIES2100_29830 [Calothrix sp. NIES-2100]